MAFVSPPCLGLPEFGEYQSVTKTDAICKYLKPPQSLNFTTTWILLIAVFPMLTDSSVVLRGYSLKDENSCFKTKVKVKSNKE